MDESRFDNIDEHTEVQEGDLEIGSPEVGETENLGMNHVRLFIAKWILKTRECRSLTRSAMQGIIKDTMSLLDFAASNIRTAIIVLVLINYPNVMKFLTILGTNSLMELQHFFSN